MAKKKRKPAKKTKSRAKRKPAKKTTKAKKKAAPKKRRGRPPVGAHKPARKGRPCKVCQGPHSAHQHDAHGFGAFARVHGGIGQAKHAGRFAGMTAAKSAESAAAMFPPGASCKRCKGAGVVKLGKNRVTCPTCKGAKDRAFLIHAATGVRVKGKAGGKPFRALTKKKNPRKGRPAVKAHAPARKNYPCLRCGEEHSAHQHEAHGFGSHERVHGGIGKARKKRAKAHAAGLSAMRSARGMGAAGGKRGKGKTKKNCSRNPLIGVMSLARPFMASNPGRSKKAPARVGATVRYKDLSPALQKKYRSAALQAARFASARLEDVILESVPTPAGFARDHAFVEVGEELAVEYRVRGKKSARHGHVWRHAGGDQGSGKKRTARPIIAIDPKTGQRVLVARRGSRPGFSSDRGLIG